MTTNNDNKQAKKLSRELGEHHAHNALDALNNEPTLKPCPKYKLTLGSITFDVREANYMPKEELWFVDPITNNILGKVEHTT